MSRQFQSYQPGPRERPRTFHGGKIYDGRSVNSVDVSLDVKGGNSYQQSDDFKRMDPKGRYIGNQGIRHGRLKSQSSTDSGVNSMQSFSSNEEFGRRNSGAEQWNGYDNNTHIRPPKCGNGHGNVARDSLEENGSSGYVEPANLRPSYTNPNYKQYPPKDSDKGYPETTNDGYSHIVQKSASHPSLKVPQDYRYTQPEASPIKPSPAQAGPRLPYREEHKNQENKAKRSGSRWKLCVCLLLVLVVGVGIGIGAFFLIDFLKNKDACDTIEIENGRMVNDDGIKKGDTLDTTCNSGFQQNSTESIVCLSTGAWSAAPECLRVSCPAITNNKVENGTLVIGKNKFEFEDQICVECNPNHIHVLARCMTCQADGTWSEKPKCRKRECSSFDVTNGKVDISDDHANVTCITGYEIKGNARVTCDLKTEEWSPKPECHIVDCGQIPETDNGTITYNKTTYMATATVICNTGFFPGGIDRAQCLATGNWSAILTCITIICDEFDPPPHAMIVDGSNKSFYGDWRTVGCDPGFSFVDGTGFATRNTTCAVNQTWTNIPDCEIAGSVSIAANKIWTIGNPASIICSYTLPTDWQRVFLAVYNSSNTLWVGRPKSVSDAVMEVIDDVVILTKTYNIPAVTCSDEQLYICGIVAGDEQNGEELKNSTQFVFVTEEIDKPAVLTMPNVVLLKDSVTIKCKGYLGKDDEGMKLGGVYIYVKTRASTEFQSAESARSFSLDGCRYQEMVDYVFTAQADLDGMQVKCVTQQGGHEELESNVATLTVAKVGIHASPEEFFVVGEQANITCSADDVPGWTSLTLMRNTTVILTVYNNGTFTPLGAEYSVNISTLDDNSVDVTLDTDSVICHLGVLETYACVVEFENGSPITANTPVDIFSKPSMVEFNITEQIIEHRNSRWDIRSKCDANVGYAGDSTAGGYIQIWSDVYGEWSVLESRRVSVDPNNTVGATSPCSKRQIITFNMLTVEMDLHRTHIKCVVVPHRKFTDAETLHSQIETIKIVPGNICEGKMTEVLSHPYSCASYVVCDPNQIPEKLLAISHVCTTRHTCFDEIDYNCKHCSYCGITDLYAEGVTSAVSVNSAHNLTCLADGFHSVTNITISHSGSPIASSELGLIDTNRSLALSTADTESGILRIELTDVQCEDAGTYSCDVMGEGKMKENSLSLDVTEC